MRIRGGSGLGDAVYIRPIAEYFAKNGQKPTVCSDHPDVFLGSGAETAPFSRDRIDVLAHYASRKADPDTNQWQDICANAGITVPLAITWIRRNQALIDSIRTQAAGRKIVLVHGGRPPMARTDGFGRELLPDRAAFDAAAGILANCCLVRVGKGTQNYPVSAEIDLLGRTSTADLLDLFQACDGVLAQCSFAIPMAEVFDRPLLIVWAAGGLVAPHPYVRQITPRKVLSKPTSAAVMDDLAGWRIQEAAYAFRDRL